MTGGIENAEIADWPISIETLLPDDDMLEARIGVSGRAGVNPFETRYCPFPLPPLRPHPAAALFTRRPVPWDTTPIPPRARSPRGSSGRGRPAIHRPLRRLRLRKRLQVESVLVTFIPAAEATGRCRVKARSMARRVLTDESGRVQGWNTSMRRARSGRSGRGSSASPHPPWRAHGCS